MAASIKHKPSPIRMSFILQIFLQKYWKMSFNKCEEMTNITPINPEGKINGCTKVCGNSFSICQKNVTINNKSKLGTGRPPNP